MTAPRVGLEWPPGWTRPRAGGWPAFLGLLLFGVLVTAVAWAVAVERAIFAIEVTTGGTHEPLIGLDVAQTDVAGAGRLSRTMLRANAALGFPGVCLSVRTLSADPLLLYHTLRHYQLHPDSRAELASPTGLARIRAGDFA